MKKSAKTSQVAVKSQPKFTGWIVSLILVALILLAASLFLPLFRASNGGIILADKRVAYVTVIVVGMAIVAANYFLKIRSNKSLAIFGGLNLIAVILASIVMCTIPHLIDKTPANVVIHPAIGAIFYFVAIAGLLAQWISLFLYKKVTK